ncbi:flagellar basal body rod protein FlgB [Salinarimonas chemoclinalis]|uniref:flagellar basal body rod protein FlgB n=1 Tax=Salinarimonas chemoclinalis TaxID=3241599 RepID=UPI003557547E
MVDGIHLFSLASRKSEWLSVRQATIAENVANASTPGFRARDVEPFRDVFDRTSLQLAATRPDHLLPTQDSRVSETRTRDGWAVTHSGNSVSIEEELIKASSASREHSLATSVVKSFHRMLMQSAR